MLVGPGIILIPKLKAASGLAFLLLALILLEKLALFRTCGAGFMAFGLFNQY